MKKILALVLVLSMAMCVCAFAETAETKGEGVMTYEEYVAAELDSEVVIETYIQDRQSWWDNKATFYTQDADGAYFLYNMPCTEEEFNNILVPGAKIKVTGYKSEWSGEVEIVDATWEVLEGDYFAEPVDVTELLGTEELINKQNMLVSFTGLTVEPIGENQAFLYNWDGSGEEGNDLYFNVSVNGATYNFTVESYLRGSGTDVYEAVKAFEIGQTVDLVGYLYWYNGVNPHIIAVAAPEAAE